MMDYYEYGDIKIKKDKFHEFLNKLKAESIQRLSTFEVLKEYQGQIKRNEEITVGDSWNAHFGKILNKCSEDDFGKTLIRNIEKNKYIEIDNGATTTAYWEI